MRKFLSITPCAPMGMMSTRIVPNRDMGGPARALPSGPDRGVGNALVECDEEDAHGRIVFFDVQLVEHGEPPGAIDDGMGSRHGTDVNVALRRVRDKCPADKIAKRFVAFA
jgi:hypothetical protein